MAPPTRQLHRLSIGHDMPASRSTRAEGQSDPAQSPRVEGNESSSAESESEEESDESEESSDDESEGVSKVLAHSGITYDLSHLDTESEAQAMVGLMGEFDVVNCRASSEGFDFQLLDRPRVHIGPDSPTCTCSTFQDRPEGACQHIFVSVSYFFEVVTPLGFLLMLFMSSGFSTSCMAASSLHLRPRR
jgi:hypothetical protein